MGLAFDTEPLCSSPVLTLTLNELQPYTESSGMCYLPGLTQGSLPMSPENLFKPTQTHPPLLECSRVGTHRIHTEVTNPSKSRQALRVMPAFNAVSELQPNWAGCCSSLGSPCLWLWAIAPAVPSAECPSLFLFEEIPLSFKSVLTYHFPSVSLPDSLIPD